MKPGSRLASRLESRDFVVTAEYLPRAGTGAASIEACVGALRDRVAAVNVADNPYGVAMSSLAASVGLSRFGIEPVYQVLTRDRNRIALQSDLMGAAFLGIRNTLCLSGYHQSLTGHPESANVFDIDSIQLIAAVNKMNEEGSLMDGTKIDGEFSMLLGAVVNPFMKPLELNMLRLNKKADAGARFVQTQAVFDVEWFAQWLDAANREGLTERVAVLASVLPLRGAAEAKKLAATHTDFVIPNGILERIQSAGDQVAQKKEGLAICAEVVRKLKAMKGVRGLHILSGGNETIVPELIAAADL